MSFMSANGAVVHYRDEGPRDASAIAFINALGSDLRVWDPVAARLSESFRVIRYDLRGHGLSEDGPDRYDIADFARDLLALLDRLDVARLTIVGLSLGGVIAQELYRQRPSLFSALVLCDTAAKIGTDDSWDARMAEVERGGVAAVADAVLERWFTLRFRGERVADLKGWRAMLTRTPTRGYLAACGALKRADLRPYAGEIAVATLCLVGEEDGSTPVPLVRETAALIKDSKFLILAGAAHIPKSRATRRACATDRGAYLPQRRLMARPI